MRAARRFYHAGMGASADEADWERRVAIAPGPHADALAAEIAALGWTVVDDDAPVVVVGLVDDGAIAAPPRARAVLAVSPLTGPAAAQQAYAAGATHWLGADDAPGGLALALAFAARAARRMEPAPARRADDGAPARRDELEDWFAERGGGPAALIVVRLSRFEFVNAAFGREIGDALIAGAEARIDAWMDAFAPQAIRRRDGAEFTVALAAGGARLAEAAHALEEALAAPFVEGGAAVSVGTRVGAAAVEPGGTAAPALAAARRALAGPRASDPAPDVDRLAADLHRALDREEIAVRFQPQAALATGAIVGVEALARWRHPRRGMLGADALFAAAERAELGLALSEHIQRRAFAAAADWPEPLSRLRLSINVTAAELGRPGFAEALLERIAAAGLARGRVTAEIVETELVDDLEDAAAILARLRGAGLRVAIDDFGTGYSSLAYLKALPIDYLKIDRSLTRDIVGSERERVVVRGVIAIARSLGLGTIAEGVELEAERALLAGEGCDLYQGFLCAGAVDGAELARLVAAA